MDTRYTVRDFKNADINAIVELWNKNLSHDVMTVERFMDRVVLDDNFDARLALVAVENGMIVGFCLGIRRLYPYLTRGLEPDRGWITALFVDEPYRRQGVATAMVTAVEDRMRAQGIHEITVGAYSPNYFMAGIDNSYEGGREFFSALGYDDRGEAVSMCRGLFGFELSAQVRKRIKELEREGIRFQMYSPDCFDSLVRLAEEQFGAGWHKNILDAVRAHEAQDTIVMAVDDEEGVIGFAMRKIDGNDERFGPIGVRENLRSKGLGGILLDLQMLEMKKRGINCLYFLWTSGDAIRFYKRHGFEEFRSYRLSRKSL